MGLDTAIIVSGGIPTNPFGHIAIAFTGSGVWSEGTAGNPQGGSVSSYWIDQARRRGALSQARSSMMSRRRSLVSTRLTMACVCPNLCARSACRMPSASRPVAQQ